MTTPIDATTTSAWGELTARADGVVVMFTGSTPTGRRIMAAASETLKKVFLELGGKSAAIVLDDADPTTVATGVRSASLSNSGQICNALTRILVPRTRAAEFTDALAAEVAHVAGIKRLIAGAR